MIGWYLRESSDKVHVLLDVCSCYISPEGGFSRWGESSTMGKIFVCMWHTHSGSRGGGGGLSLCIAVVV